MEVWLRSGREGRPAARSWTAVGRGEVMLSQCKFTGFCLTPGPVYGVTVQMDSLACSVAT